MSVVGLRAALGTGNAALCGVALKLYEVLDGQAAWVLLVAGLYAGGAAAGVLGVVFAHEVRRLRSAASATREVPEGRTATGLSRREARSLAERSRRSQVWTRIRAGTVERFGYDLEIVSILSLGLATSAMLLRIADLA